MTMNEAINEILTIHGKDILLDGMKFYQIFNTLAPEMKTKNSIIRKLVLENLLIEIHTLLNKTQIKSEDILKFKNRLDNAGISEAYKNDIIAGFGLSETYNTDEALGNTEINFSVADISVGDNAVIHIPLEGIYYLIESYEMDMYRKYKYHVRCIRFYSDGKVVNATVHMDNISQINKIRTWLIWNNHNSQGYYNTTEDGHIRFYVSSIYGTVLNEGWIEKDDIRRLHLKWYSVLNGKTSESYDEYQLY